jgi:hypothetical protein
MNDELPSDPERVAHLPEHLRFFVNLPDLNALELEEVLPFYREHLRKTRLHREELIAHGLAADVLIAGLEPRLKMMEQKLSALDKADDKLLNLEADVADAKYEHFKLLEKALEEAEEEKPFDPEVQELREQVEEMRKHFPKE